MLAFSPCDLEKLRRVWHCCCSLGARSAPAARSAMMWKPESTFGRCSSFANQDTTHVTFNLKSLHKGDASLHHAPPIQLIIHQTRLHWKIASTPFASCWLVLNQLKEALAGTRALARPHQEIREPYISHFSVLFHPFFCWTTWKNTKCQFGRAAAISLSRNSLVRKMSSKSCARSRHTKSSAPTVRSLSLWPTSSP